MPQQADTPWERSPFRLDHGGDLALLHRAFEAAGYTEAAIGATVIHERSGRPLDLPAALRRTASATPFHTLVRLFVLAQVAPEERVRAVLAPARLEDLVAVGLLCPAAQGMRAAAAILPSDGLLLAREFWPSYTSLPVGEEYVPGPAPASRIVANLMVRRGGETALDVGTGSGFLALLAASHAKQVIGTDVNPRALAFAALNARLNEVANIALRLGSLLEPVADDRFDLIAANPPFVISPHADYQYRDSGREGDALCEELLRSVPSRLREQGYCSVIFNWRHANDEDWAARPREWLISSACDAWLTCFSTMDPVAYATTWLVAEDIRDPGRSARLLDAWVDHLETLHAGRISQGTVVLRRRSGGQNWFRAERAPCGEPTQACSPQIERIFAAEDLLQSLQSGGSLLDRRFVLTPDHELLQTLHSEGGRWSVEGALLRQTRGYPFVGNIDRLVAAVLAGCDGRRALGELAAELAATVGKAPEEIAPACEEVMRTLLHWGFFTVPADP